MTPEGLYLFFSREHETPPTIFGRRLGALLRRWGAGWGPLVGSKLEGVEFPAFEPARERERERELVVELRPAPY